MLIVKKFGGTSVADKERIFNVAGRIAEDYKKATNSGCIISNGKTNRYIDTNGKGHKSQCSKT